MFLFFGVHALFGKCLSVKHTRRKDHYGVNKEEKQRGDKEVDGEKESWDAGEELN